MRRPLARIAAAVVSSGAALMLTAGPAGAVQPWLSGGVTGLVAGLDVSGQVAPTATGAAGRFLYNYNTAKTTSDNLYCYASDGTAGKAVAVYQIPAGSPMIAGYDQTQTWYVALMVQTFATYQSVGVSNPYTADWVAAEQLCSTNPIFWAGVGAPLGSFAIRGTYTWTSY